MQYEFTVVIERDPESGWLIGSVSELPGCYTQAPTLAELEPNIREAVAVYLATVAEEEPITVFPAFVGVQRLEVNTAAASGSCLFEISPESPNWRASTLHDAKAAIVHFARPTAA